MDVEREILALAERQYGAVGTAQVRAVGGSRHLIAYRVRVGRWLQPRSRVVVIAGAPPTPEQRLMVEVLQAGRNALASHESAAWLWRLPGFAPAITVIRPRSHGADATEGRRPTLVLPQHRAVVRGIPCTTLPRTMFDLAGLGLHPERLLALIDRVSTQSPAMLVALHRTLDEMACRGRPGIVLMRQLLALRPAGEAVPASGLERRFESLCAAAGIVGLERQVDVGGHAWLGRADYRRRDVRLVIEVDSQLHHTSPSDVAHDELRDAAMLAAGWAAVLRIWEEDVWRRPQLVVQTVRAAIADLGASPFSVPKCA